MSSKPTEGSKNSLVVLGRLSAERIIDSVKSTVFKDVGQQTFVQEVRDFAVSEKNISKTMLVSEMYSSELVLLT